MRSTATSISRRLSGADVIPGDAADVRDPGGVIEQCAAGKRADDRASGVLDAGVGDADETRVGSAPDLAFDEAASRKPRRFVSKPISLSSHMEVGVAL